MKNTYIYFLSLSCLYVSCSYNMEQKPVEVWDGGSYGSYMYSRSGQQTPPELEEHSSASSSPQQHSADFPSLQQSPSSAPAAVHCGEVGIDMQEDIDHIFQSQAELFAEPSSRRQSPPLVASAAPTAEHPGEVIIDMQDINRAAELQAERFTGCAALRQSNQDVEAALTRGNMLMRARKKRAIAVARQTVATGDTSSALIMSTLIAPAMLENVVTLFMDWDSMASADRIAKITAVAGAIGCIVFAWVRKSMQQKKLNDGSSDPSDISDPMEDMSNFVQSISGAVSNAITSARGAAPAPAPSVAANQNSDITSAIQAITSAVSSAITSAHAAAPAAPSAPAKK